MKALALATQAGVPTLVWGSPGTGKTSYITSMGEALGLPVEVVIASIREPSDFGGLPVVKEEGVYLHPPAWARRLVSSGKGILFLDEISTAPPAVQAALLRVVLDRVVGDLELPAEVAIVAAANPPEQAAGGWDLSPPLANRFCHLSWSLDTQAWVEGMVSGFPTPNIPKLPDEWQKHIPSARSLVASFIRHRQHLLLQVPKDEDQAGRAWPSPRSWDMASRLLAACEAIQAGDDVVVPLISGCVGEGAGMEFLTWRRNLDLPNPEDLLKNPTSFSLPERGDKAYAILTAVATAAVQNLTKDRWLAAWDILSRAAKQGGKDIAASAAKTLAAARRPNLPLPTKQLQEFIPLLKQGGLM